MNFDIIEQLLLYANHSSHLSIIWPSMMKMIIPLNLVKNRSIHKRSNLKLTNGKSFSDSTNRVEIKLIVYGKDSEWLRFFKLPRRQERNKCTFNK